MIKLKSILETIQNSSLYHVTPLKNLPSIKQHGIKPTSLSPVRIGNNKAVYLFDDRTTMEDAVMNWLSDKFDENEPLVCLKINPTGLHIISSDVGYEVMTYDIVPWKNIIGVEKL